MKGFAALISVIIIGAVLVAVGMMVTLTAVNEGQMSLSGYQKIKSRSLTQACAEEALMSVNKKNSLPPSITTLEGVCAVSLNSQTGTSWDFTVSSVLSGYHSAQRIVLDRTTAVSVISWQDQ